MKPQPPSVPLVYKEPPPRETRAEFLARMAETKKERCSSCDANNGAGHVRWCKFYTGQHPKCFECKVSTKAENSPHLKGCSKFDPNNLHEIDRNRLEKMVAKQEERTRLRENKKKSAPCGCTNHLGEPKTVYPNKSAANGWSRKRWAGLATVYVCKEGNIHLSTSGSIRVRSRA